MQRPRRTVLVRRGPRARLPSRGRPGTTGARRAGAQRRVPRPRRRARRRGPRRTARAVAIYGVLRRVRSERDGMAFDQIVHGLAGLGSAALDRHARPLCLRCVDTTSERRRWANRSRTSATTFASYTGSARSRYLLRLSAPDTQRLGRRRGAKCRGTTRLCAGGFPATNCRAG
jgi:hypothetical protein